MKEPKYKYSITDVEVATSPDGKGIMILAETVDYKLAVQKRSGKRISLALSPNQAMRLLSILQAVQRQFGYPDHPPPELIVVPPEADRN